MNPSISNPAQTNPSASIFSSSSPTLSSLTDPHSSSPNPDIDNDDPLTPSLVLNIFLSIIITGFSVYFALTSFQTSELKVPFISSDRKSSRMSEPVRVLVSLVGAVVVGVAEVVIYAVYLGKVSRAKDKEGRVRERKVVVGSEEVVGRKNDGDGDGDGEKEEIWGRGANGGLRRRVREKWEERERDE